MSKPPESETMYKLKWLMSPLLPATALASIYAYSNTEDGYWLYLGPALVATIAPLLDWLIGKDTGNCPASMLAAREKDPYYRLLVYAFIPPQLLMILLSCELAASGDLSFSGWTGLILTVGIINGIGMNTAHEIGHKRTLLDRWLAKVCLAPVLYGHMTTGHNLHHHKFVATPEDPVSAQLGEPFYAFWIRVVTLSFGSAWNVERARLRRQGKSVWNPSNQVLQAWSLSVLFFVAMPIVFGEAVLMLLVPQAIIGFTLFELVSYLEHYGLLRQKRADGSYERCTPQHSWNSDFIFSNLVLYQLARHSDHHANPTRPYQVLRHCDESPQLPFGYGTMIMIALVPPLWFRLMDHRVVAHYDGNPHKANLWPPRRAQLLRRYGQASAA